MAACLNEEMKIIEQPEMKDNIFESAEMEAIKNGKIYTIIGQFHTLKKSLKQRGWIENYKMSQVLKSISEDEASDIEIKKSKFIWKPRYYPYPLEMIMNPLLNRIDRARELDFTFKDGLKNCAENAHWHLDEEMDAINIPRTHILTDKESHKLFFEDFKLTKILGFLSFLNNSQDFPALFSKKGSISVDCIELALKKVNQFIALNVDCDVDLAEPPDLFTKYPHKYNKMIMDFFQITELDKKLKLNNEISLDELKQEISDALENAIKVWPNRRYDESKNYWIIKPVAMCRGEGIKILNNYTEIINFLRKNFTRKYLVQKYIERPFLIYNTKFDIRQYFLTFFFDGRVTLWMYKNCYLKFSSREFNFRNFDRSIHITNHNVQKHFKQRNSNLPEEKMWLLKDFQEFLKANDSESIWKEKIYRGMKNQILGVVMTSLESTSIMENSFELNGADFMIGFDHEPIFLEVNASPDLSFTTRVTEEICRKVMEDLVKVTIDYPSNPESSTGDFELILDMKVPKVANEYQADLMVIGRNSDTQH